MMTYCLSTNASKVILPAQDLIEIDNAGRMNTPGTLTNDNWSYRLDNFDELTQAMDFLKPYIKKRLSH